MTGIMSPAQTRCNTPKALTQTSCGCNIWDMSQIGTRLRTIRIERGLAQEEVARRAGVALNTVVRAELGRVTPSTATVLKLAEALDVSAGDLLEDADDDPTPATTTA
jgi:DNA-binding XRE family transcriptional regulator